MTGADGDTADDLAELEAGIAAAEAAGASAFAVDPRELLPGEEPPECDPVSGVPKVLTACVVHEEPKITVIPHFLSDAEVEHLLEISKDFWIPSVVGTGVYRTNDESKDLTNKPSKNRTSHSCLLRSAQTPVVHQIEQRLAHLAGIDADYLERLNMVRYAPGQLFNRHHDGRFRPKTVFVYLNDLPDGDGGETLFSELGLKVVPRRGCAVMWSNTLGPGEEDARTYHQGLPPRTAMKFGVNCFFNAKPMKRWEDVDSDLGDEEGSIAIQKPSERWRTIAPLDLLEVPEAGGAPPAHADPQVQKLRAFSVCQEPKVLVIPLFCSADDLRLLEACSSARGPEAAAAGGMERIARIEERMALVAALPRDHMDPLRVSRCGPGMTPDGQALAGDDDYRRRFGHAVVHVFLNDVPRGGELRFPRLGLQIQACAGCAVVWASADPRAVHQGRPPKAGDRLSATGVFRDRPVR